MIAPQMGRINVSVFSVLSSSRINVYRDGQLLTDHPEAPAKDQKNSREHDEDAAATASGIGAIRAARAGVAKEIAAAKEGS
jgi:hypothetical protein